MSDNENIINFDGFSQVGCTLIEKISSAVGWVATHDTPKRIAVKQYIEDIQNSDLDPLLKAAKITRAKRDIKEYCNQAKIISDAVPQLNISADPSKMDDDWLASFMDKARLVNSESLRAIWSRILAQECNANHSIPKHLLDILSYISPTQAHKFNLLCQFSVRFIYGSSLSHVTPIITSAAFNASQSDIYSLAGLSYFDLQDLESIGLIQYSSSQHVMEFMKLPTQPDVFVGKKRFSFEQIPPSQRLNLGTTILTTVGNALSTIIDCNPSDEFCKTCIELWTSQGFVLTSVCADQAESPTADTAIQN